MLSETTGDIWEYQKTHRIVIPTNTEGAMGRGLALQARKKYPGLYTTYRVHLNQRAARVSCPVVLKDFPDLILYPVKHSWRDKARDSLIAGNLTVLEFWNDRPIALPELGCGFGEKTWEEIKPLLEILQHQEGEYLIVHPDSSLGQKYSDSFRPSSTRSDARFS